MKTAPYARRYARALLDTAGSEAETFASQLETLEQFFTQQPASFAALSMPTLTGAQRHSLLEVIISNSDGLSPLVANFLRLLADRNRIEGLPMINRQFRALVDERTGTVRGTLTSAVKLDDAQVKAISQSLEKHTQRHVVLETSVDPAVLGGVVATVGNERFDGTLRAQLDALKAQLLTP